MQNKKHQGGCHRRKVRFEAVVETNKGITCNCSICLKRGTILAFTPEDQFKILSGGSELAEYLFNKKKIHHYFCKNCGILPFARSQMPDGTPMRAINLRCIDGIEIDAIEVQKYNGRDI